ncbi:MAG: beta strand repeat-containing protein [Acetobacteraceae bacterium]
MGGAHRARAGTRGIACFRLRWLLAASTALTALAVVQPAHAQAPLAAPTGGAVVAGSAQIAQAPGATMITQSTERAAINWQSFNVGSRAAVSFHQPSSQAVTLNRVVAPDPSTIAGRITANGSIVLVNPDGVVFANGAEVNAAGLVVSAPGITNKNFMAGRMIFDQPANPNARIVNGGSITIAKAGLAALVAPEVANSGVIAAKLGSVVLAGARTATLDLYGDGLVSLDVQGAVRTVPVGPDGKPVQALVTNNGTIVAEGGTVLLTAKAVDGLIQNLVDASGTIAANGARGQPAGTILVQGVGGSIASAGTLLADGAGSRGTGGAIGLDASGGVSVAKTARVDASGPAGGGVVAVGTTLARARGGPGTPASLTAANVTIAPGATISADATTAGNGGRVTVQSRQTTADHGAITAEGGPNGGNGGFVEISGHDLALDGTVNAGAPLGTTGTILLDPFDLTIEPNGCCDDEIITTTPPDAVNGVAYNSGDTTVGVDSTVSSGAIEALVGNVTLQAIDDVTFAGDLALTKPNQSLLVQAGNNIFINSGATVSASGNIEMDASSTAIPGFVSNGSVQNLGSVTAGGNVALSAGTGGIILGDFKGNDGSVSANPSTGALVLSTGGSISQNSGIITAGTLSATAVSATMELANQVGTLGAFSILAGEFLFFNDASDLVVAGPVSGAEVSLDISSNGNLTVAGPVNVAPSGFAEFSSGGNLTVTGSINAAGGAVDLLSSDNLTVAGPINVPGGRATLSAAGDLVLSGEVNVTGETVTVTAGGSITEPGGAVLADTLGGSSGGAALFTGVNTIGTLANIANSVDPPPPAFSAGGNFTLVDSEPLTITAPITVPNGDTLTVVTDSLIEGSQTIFEPSFGVIFGALQAPGGEVSLEPFTAGVPVALVGAGLQPAGTLAIDDTLLAAITAGTLALTSSGSAPITISGANTLGGLTDPNTDAPSGVTTLAVNAGGAFTEAPGASLDVGALMGSANSVALNGANLIPILEEFASVDGFSLSDGEALTVLGSVSDPSGITLAVAPGGLTIGSGGTAGTLKSNGTVDLQVPGGTIVAADGGVTAGTLVGTASNLAVFGSGSEIGALGSFTVSGAGSELSLTNGVPLAITGPVTAGTFFIGDTGAVTESGSGVLDVGVLTGNAASVALGGANEVAILEEFASSGGFELTDIVGLTVLGSVTDPTGIDLVVAPGSLAIGSGGNAGTLQSAGTVNLQVPDGSITLPNGSLIAGTLSGAAAGLADFGTEDVTMLGSFAVSGAAGELALTSTVPLTISGPVSAAFLDVAAPGTLTLSGTILTTGLPLADQSGTNPALPGSVLQVLSGGVFQELGTSVIAPLGAGDATVRIQLPGAGGLASFANLEAGATNLVLALGPGQATGTMRVGGLLVIGTGGSANLFGSVDGISGLRAAGAARIEPAINTKYLFNGCVIQTTVCSATLVQVPQGSPNLLATGGGPSLLASATLPSVVLMTIPAEVGETWTDAGGFPLPNIARLDF